MSDIRIPIVLGEGAKVPTRATKGSAGYDLVCPVNTELKKGRGKIDLNIKMAIPYGVAGIIKPRSGFTLLGFEAVDFWGNVTRIECDGKDGVIDSDYTGIISVMIRNNHHVGVHVCKAGTRIAQILFVPVLDAHFVVVDQLPSTDRGEGGFNSTGTH